MEKCPLCGEVTMVGIGNGRKMCVNGNCGWTYPVGSCADVGDISKLIPYVKDKERVKKYIKLTLKKTGREGERK